MQTESNKTTITRHSPLVLQFEVSNFHMVDVPGFKGSRMGTCYVKVTELPSSLERFTDVNPRTPARTKRGSLSGSIAKGILDTLFNRPQDMSLKNQGIFLLVQKAISTKENIKLIFTDRAAHGIVNGGHTYAAIREAIESATPEELKSLEHAYVKLHVFENIDKTIVANIAEGLNRSKQVDDLSLVNLQGQFDRIRKVMRNEKGAEQISYYQGDAGQVYISDVLVQMYLFDRSRFDDQKAPNVLYNKSAVALRMFKEDVASNAKNAQMLIEKLPEFLKLGDTIKKLIPDAARANKFKFGMVKMGGSRTGAQVYLPFIDEMMDYRIPNGWLYPILAAYRANLRPDGGWLVPLEEIVPATIDSLVSVLVGEHRYGNMRPEIIGKRESTYNQCYSKVQIYLAKKRLI